MEGGSCQEALGGIQAGTTLEVKYRGPGKERSLGGGRREFVDGWEEDYLTVLSNLAVISDTPEECCLLVVMFEQDSISPVRAMFTPFSAFSVMGDFLM